MLSHHFNCIIWFNWTFIGISLLHKFFDFTFASSKSIQLHLNDELYRFRHLIYNVSWCWCFCFFFSCCSFDFYNIHLSHVSVLWGWWQCQKCDSHKWCMAIVQKFCTSIATNMCNTCIDLFIYCSIYYGRKKNWFQFQKPGLVSHCVQVKTAKKVWWSYVSNSNLLLGYSADLYDSNIQG